MKAFKNNTKILTVATKRIIRLNLDKEPNFLKVGSPTINNGVVSGFSASNYCLIPSIPLNVSSFEFMFKVTTGSDITTYNSIIGQESGNYTTPQITPSNMSSSGIVFGISQDGSTWSNVKLLPVNLTSANTTYWLKCIWDGSALYGYYSLNGVDWVHNSTLANVTVVQWTTPLAIGIDSDTKNSNKYWKGSIDLNESYIKINGEMWWSAYREVTICKMIPSVADNSHLIHNPIITSTSGWTNPEYAFDGNLDTYASCGTATDYIQIEYHKPKTVSSIVAQGMYAAEVARTMDLRLYSVVDGVETLLCTTTGASKTSTYTTSGTCTATTALVFRIRLATKNSAGQAPTTTYKSRMREITLS